MSIQMNRRNFIGLMVGGVAVAAAVRTFPFRVFSFPKGIKRPIDLAAEQGIELESFAQSTGVPVWLDHLSMAELKVMIDIPSIWLDQARPRAFILKAGKKWLPVTRVKSIDIKRPGVAGPPPQISFAGKLINKSRARPWRHWKTV